MLNKLLAFTRKYSLIQPGDQVICAVSGGADSVALLFAMYLLQKKLQIQLKAAHFNHGLRGEESDRDEAFVRQLCDRYDIPLSVGSAKVTAGKKGLEAAAREARYQFFDSLPGKIATAHTADDNAETVLMHMLRGTGLKGLGGIAPVRGKLIRPMLSVTREQVMAFLDSYHLEYVFDSTNASDAFLRNRLRHRVMPLLREENPRLAENLSQMALSLREDEATLSMIISEAALPGVLALRQMETSMRRRYLVQFLKQNGVPEPERTHIQLCEQLILSDNPSAEANLPGNVILKRCYDELKISTPAAPWGPEVLTCPGELVLTQCGVRILAEPAMAGTPKKDDFVIRSQGTILVRSRCAGDRLRLSGGTKTLKEIMIDRKIPAALRPQLPVLADDLGVLGVWGIGANLDRLCSQGQGVRIRMEKL